MPNIRPYDSPAEGISPTERGSDAALQTGRRVGQAYETAGGNIAASGARIGSGVASVGESAVQFMEHREISAGAAAFAVKQQKITDAWNEKVKNADPNDPTLAAQFRDGMEADLDKLREGFLTEGGQRFAESRIQSMRSHMFEKTAADMSTLAGQAVKVNYEKTANTMSNTAMTDPSSVPHLISSIDGDVENMVASSPNLKGADAARARMELTQKAKESIVKAGAVGAIQQAADPEAEAEKWGKKYPEYISGADLKALSSNARQQIRADRIDQTYRDTIEKKAAEQVSDATETGYLQRLYSDDPKEQAQVSTKAIVNDKTLTRVAKERMINVVNREMKPETDAKISAQSSVELMRAMRDPNADPQAFMTKLYEARTKDPGTAGSITKADFNDLQKQFVDMKTPQGLALTSDRNEFFKRYNNVIDPAALSLEGKGLPGKLSALGEQRIYAAEKDARRLEDVLKSKGLDPHLVYDPRSEYFFGSPKNLSKYHVSLQESAAYQASIEKKGGLNLTSPGNVITGSETTETPRISTQAEYEKLPAGGKYFAPDGSLRTKGGK